MGKPSKRPGRNVRDLHARIRESADRLRLSPRLGVRDVHDFPELAELMQAARQAVESAMPTGFDFHGRRYYLRVRLAALFDLFDGPAAVCTSSSRMRSARASRRRCWASRRQRLAAAQPMPASRPRAAATARAAAVTPGPAPAA